MPILTALLKDREAAVRRTAARSLAQMPDAAVLSALDEAMDKNLLVSAIVEQAGAIAAKAGTEATAKLLAKMLTVAAGEKSVAVAAAPSKAAAPAPDEGAAPSRGRGGRASRGRGGPPRGRGPSQPPSSSPTPAPPARKAGEPGMATPMMILEAINRLGLYSPEVKTALEAAREAPDADVRAAAYKAREQAIAAESAADRSASAVAAAALALKDQAGTVRCAGIALLSAADPKEALALLMPAVKDPDPGVRAAALAALPEIADDPDIAAAINDALGDPSPAVVRAAAVAAARRPALGAEVQAALSQAVGPLTLHLTDPNLDVRFAAIRALGKLKDPAAVSSLQSVLTDKDTRSSRRPSARSARTICPMPSRLRSTRSPSATRPFRMICGGKILARLAAHCADAGSAYGAWAASGPALKESDLHILEEMAPAAAGDVRSGLIALATRYLTDSRLEAKKRAATILACYADDAAVRKVLLDALEQDTTGIAQGAADALRRIRDDSMIDVPLLAYYKALCEAPGAPAGPGMRGGRGPLGPFGGARPGMPAAGAPATTPPKFPGLVKATAEDNAALRAAIIEALGAIGGDTRGKGAQDHRGTRAEEKQRRDGAPPHRGVREAPKPPPASAIFASIT